MKKVRFLDEPKEENLKPIEFTHYLDSSKGWQFSRTPPKNFQEIIYLGKCPVDGDMFCAKTINESISIYKGHLNDGVY